MIPGTIYLCAFTIYTWPWTPRFSSHFFANDGDGLQNVWNNWWVDHAVRELHQSPWNTSLLHAPHGTTLLGQTMNSFNGFVGIVLMRWFSIVQTYNLLVTFSYVFGGITACWLCYSVTRRYWPSIIGGYSFTFSAFHMASGIGFMQLVSLEWIPLFVMLWWRLLTRPSYPRAVGAAAMLFLVLLCDYYYFLYSLAAAVLIVSYLALRGEVRWTRHLFMFLGMAAAICGPLPIQLIRYNSHDRLLGFHDARVFSTDFLSTFIDGGFWRFAPLTNWYWDRIHSPLSSSSVYVGMSVLFAIVIVYDQRRRSHRDARFWLGFGVLFWVVSLGPRLLILGQTHPTVPLPYALLEHLIPPLKLGGNPYRTILMSTLAAGVIVAIFLSRLNLSARRGRLKMLLFCGVLALEMWPAQMPSTRAAHPRYVDVLKRLPGPGAVYDAAAPSPTWQLYYQTVHEKPIAGGYISRVPTSVNREDRALEAAVVAGQFNRLCTRFAIRYYTTPANQPIVGSQFPKVYSGPDALIYDLTRDGSCR